MKHIKLFEAWEDSQMNPENLGGIPVGDVTKDGEIVIAYSLDTNGGVALMSKEDPMIDDLLSVLDQIKDSLEKQGIGGRVEIFETPGIAFISRDMNENLSMHGTDTDVTSLQDHYWIDAINLENIQHDQQDFNGWVSSLKRGVITDIRGLHDGPIPIHRSAEDWLDYYREWIK